MSLSEDEDDFLSADEEGFGDNLKVEVQVQKNKLSVQVEAKPDDDDEVPSKNKNKPVIESVKAKTITNSQQDSTTNTSLLKNVDTAPSSSTKYGLRKNSTTVQDEDVEDEEEALAERIRERNIKIARKFSQEISKNVKASAPIPVKIKKPIDSFTNNDTDYPINPDSDIKSSPPPAPPPTPALASSFNSEESPNSGTQYSWRVPSKISRPNPPEESPTDAKIEQTRLALDRLSASLAQADNKKLFEKVADDIKKVSLRSSVDSPAPDGISQGSAGIPLISELSSTLGGWKWGGASKLLASASQVTSQVSSVFDSVVNVSQLSQPVKSIDETTETSTSQPKQFSESRGEQTATSNPTTSTSESGANDGLMDFTLNTMESLGKRAFGVMTERNESGSLQIKGLGRPWEHLMNARKSQPHEADSEPTLASSSVVDNCKKKND